MKKTLVFILLIIAAILLGGLIGAAAKGVSVVNWLSYSKGFGIDTTTLDLSIFSISFGCSFSMNVAQLILILTALFAHPKICKTLGV